MIETVLQDYWNDRAVIRREAARSGQADLTERLAWQDVLRRHIGAGRNLRVLDVGTGCSIIPAVMADMRHRCTGVDQSLGLIDIAKQRAVEAGHDKNEFLQSDVSALDFPNAAFAAVVAVNVVSQLAQPREALREWARVLRPGGKLVIVEDDRDSAEFPTFYKHQVRNSSSPLESHFQQALENVPLWMTRQNETEAFLGLNDWENIQSSHAMGQLSRSGRFGLKAYTVGYCLTSATKPGSIPL